jgi:cell fate regulator YaaT (PSP1 superfamily)
MVLVTAQRIAGVRFAPVGKVYHFDASAYPELKPGDYVIVETARGRQLGKLVQFVDMDEADLSSLKPIKAPATARDLMMNKLWEAKEVEALIVCREASTKYPELETAKWVKADYNYDGSMLALLYTSEEPLNTNRIRRHLEKEFHARIEIRRIGARDAAKLLGEYGACGGPRCCSTHLTEFSPISIKMAKAQGISLNPSEITGMCGRLRCCLIYEYEQYIEAKKLLPKIGKQIGTPYGPGKVIDLNPLVEKATVIVGDTRYELHREQLVPLEQLQALAEKAGQGCTREGTGGVCECGARVRSGPVGQVPPASEFEKPESQSIAASQPQIARPQSEYRQRREEPSRHEQPQGQQAGADQPRPEARQDERGRRHHRRRPRRGSSENRPH